MVTCSISWQNLRQGFFFASPDATLNAILLLMIRVNISKFDEAVVRLISNLPSGLRPFFTLISHVGHPITISSIGFMIAAYSIFQQKLTIALGGTFVWLALVVSTLLKRVIKRTRPLTKYVAGMRFHSFSFPSGHTMGSTTAFGLLAYYGAHFLPSPFNAIALVLCVLLIFLVGISRIYLGAHYPTDVIGGWILGAMILGIVISVVEPLQ